MTATETPDTFLTWSKTNDAWERQLRQLMPYAEELWSRVQMVVAGDRKQAGICAVAGLLEGDGASTTAAALAHFLAQGAGARVVLVQTDLRGASLREIELPPRTPGLSGLLASRAELKQAVFELQRVGFHVLPAGNAPKSPLTLLSAARLRQVLDALRSEFDVVLLDTAPLSLAPEARQVVAAADATVVVLRSGRTVPEQAAYWLGKIGEYGGRVGAVCFNGVEHQLPNALRGLL